MDSATPDDPLWTIVYVSSASYAFSPLDLERLLASARLSNQAAGSLSTATCLQRVGRSVGVAMLSSGRFN